MMSDNRSRGFAASTLAREIREHFPSSYDNKINIDNIELGVNAIVMKMVDEAGFMLNGDDVFDIITLFITTVDETYSKELHQYYMRHMLDNCGYMVVDAMVESHRSYEAGSKGYDGFNPLVPFFTELRKVVTNKDPLPVKDTVVFIDELPAATITDENGSRSRRNRDRDREDSRGGSRHLRRRDEVSDDRG